MRSSFNYLMQAFSSKERNQFSRGLAGNRQRRRLSRQTSYQAMEPRLLLAGIEFLPETSQVLIGGTPIRESATVQQSGDVLTVNLVDVGTRTFKASGITSILFVGLGGDDFFQNLTSIPSFAFGGSGEDVLIGGSGNDTLVGNSQNDQLSGNGGDDTLIAGIGDDRISGGGGNDRILGVAGTNFLNGNGGDDTIFGGLNRDNITGGSGDDLLAGSEGDDNILANDGADLIFGGSGNDRVEGGTGNDRVYGQNGNDTILGGLGEDFLNGNGGNDRFFGEFGNDRIIGGPGGDDRATFNGLFSDFTAEFNGDNATVQDLRIFGNEGLDTLTGINQVIFDNAFQNAGGPPVFTGPQPIPEVDPNAPPVIVNNNPIVTLQPIIVSNDDGSNTAEFFGNDEQEADVLERIDAIFDQAGVDIVFLPEVTQNSTFVNIGDGDLVNGERPPGDLGAIVQQGDDAGLGSPNALVIDIYFVEFVPGFPDLGENSANGLAFVGAPGIAIQIGDNLPETDVGRNVIAEVTAHEIGHNLGLQHLEVEGNLLAPSGFGDGGSDLNNDQITMILNSPLSV